MSDHRAEVRCEVIAELADTSLRRHAAGHADLYEQAVEHGRDDMANRA